MNAKYIKSRANSAAIGALSWPRERRNSFADLIVFYINLY